MRRRMEKVASFVPGWAVLLLLALRPKLPPSFLSPRCYSSSTAKLTAREFDRGYRLRYLSRREKEIQGRGFSTRLWTRCKSYFQCFKPFSMWGFSFQFALYMHATFTQYKIKPLYLWREGGSKSTALLVNVLLF